jgi:predicted Rossmann fold nucleotide-binding protein DprA/Smf involved in DNA uptake
MGGRDTTLASLLLVNRLVDVDAKPLPASEYWPLLRRVDDPATLLGASVAEVAARLDGDTALAKRIVTLLDAGTALSLKLDALTEQGITTITNFDDDYPPRLRERLGDAAPPLLFCAGHAELLAARSIGVVGSREVSKEGGEVAEALAREIAKDGVVLTTGGSRGVDQLAMRAALDAGGRVVGVLADPLTRALRPPDTRRHVIKGHLALCTPFPPDAAYTAANAMARNKIVYALNDTTIVVAVDEGADSTWTGATEALEHRYGAVRVWTGAGAGPDNEALVSLGAQPISSNVESTTPFDAARAEHTDSVELPFT